ncbi:hypothetical protein C4J81_14630 [Deltaproteobacteria bacterium Smac51]|nr:hypothetical protein C4J81_14630 [Deltaproteobacteria bacterium Smac51]
MELMLEIISRHKFLAEIKPTCVFSEVGGYIGRSEESDWVLPDRGRRVSRKHVLITCDSRDFYLEDLSSNGVLWTLTQELVGKNGRHKISHGDSYQIGDYVLQARLLMSPETYTPPQMDATENIIPDDAFIDLDPLKALDQEDEHSAKQRLGFYDTLLGEKPQPPETSLGDHNEARLDALGPIRARPDDLLAPRPDLNIPPLHTAGGAATPLQVIEESIEHLNQTMARLAETLRTLERARDGLKRGEPQPLIPEDLNLKDLL